MLMRHRLAGNARNHFQGIHIEKASAVQLHACENRIIEGPLHHVPIGSLYLIFQHPGGEKHQADGSTGLRISRIIGKIIILRESLPKKRGTDATSDIHPPFRNALPEPIAGFFQLLIIGFGSQICHGCIEIHGPDTVASGFVQLPHRALALLVSVIRRISSPYLPGSLSYFFFVKSGVCTAYIQKMLRQIQAKLIPSCAVHPKQRQLHLRVPRVALMAFRHKMMVNALGIFQHHLQKPVFSGRLIVGHCRLHHMTRAVKLMAFQQVGPALVPILYRVVGVQIAVRVLGSGDDIDNPVRRGLQLRIREKNQRISHSLQPFGRVAVLKDHAIEAVSHILSSESLPCIDEVPDHMAFFHALHLIAKHPILIRNHHILDEMLITADKTLGGGEIFE